MVELRLHQVAREEYRGFDGMNYCNIYYRDETNRYLIVDTYFLTENHEVLIHRSEPISLAGNISEVKISDRENTVPWVVTSNKGDNPMVVYASIPEDARDEYISEITKSILPQFISAERATPCQVGKPCDGKKTCSQCILDHRASTKYIYTKVWDTTDYKDFMDDYTG